MGAYRVFGDAQIQGRALGTPAGEQAVKNVGFCGGQVEGGAHGRYCFGIGRQRLLQDHDDVSLAWDAVQIRPRTSRRAVDEGRPGGAPASRPRRERP